MIKFDQKLFYNLKEYTIIISINYTSKNEHKLTYKNRFDSSIGKQIIGHVYST